ncbi:unnamed protein product [Polarella glacialis]|uniref:Large ribosomal subunit protein uL15/eL18 domain-containing protein n=1 Tax=Polarella glacialis TaxID=89957 RepID=A0A813E0S6_POLGL|nr:unnamed protein product [Polarella glacialis]CAE8610802.1 unnamed protein product [Polarella glacialis]
MARTALGPLMAAYVGLLGAPTLTDAFAVLAAANSPAPKSLGSPRLTLQRANGASPAAGLSTSRGSGNGLCGAVVALFAAGALARRGRRSSAAARNAFSSSSSGFMGSSCASTSLTSSSWATPACQDDDPYQAAASSGLRSMEMKAQVWWIRNNGFDGPAKGGAKIFDSRRRESRRRGEELFRHDVDNFELCIHNLIPAPGSRKKRIIRGRGKYGHHGRTCGWGKTSVGAKKRGRRTINPGYEGGQFPLHITTPILSKEDRDSMKQDPFTPISLKVLNMCEDGDEVDFMELVTRGFPLKKYRKFDRVKVKGTDKDVFEVKNLTVYAHAFEPPAREKIEKNGGRCIRLSEFGNLPVDENAVKVNLFPQAALVEVEAPAAE